MDHNCVELTAFCEPDTRTRWQRFKSRLFPSKHCFTPASPFISEGRIAVESVTTLDWRDRLRVLLTGIVVVKVKTVTERDAGRQVSNSVCYIGTKRDLLP